MIINGLMKEFETLNLESKNFNSIKIELGEIQNKILEKKIGILNLAQSCYINSSIQLFLHNELFVVNFINNINNYPNIHNSLFNQMFCLFKIRK